MSAPTVERGRRSASRTVPARSGSARPAPVRTAPARAGSARAGSAGRTESGAVGRAYARKAGRSRPGTDPGRINAIGRSRFVLLVMGLLGSGLVASLWLSTSAAADSYRLDAATRATRDLSERSETLRTEIAAMRSAPALAKAARDLGMVPTTDVARLVAEPGGGVIVVGVPKAAYAPAPAMAPPPPMPAVPPAVPGQPGAVPGAVPNGAGQPGAGAVTDQQGVVPSRPVGAPPAQAAGGAQPQQTAPAQQQPSTSRPSTSQPSVSQPSVSQPSTSRPSTSRPPTSQPSAQTSSRAVGGTRP